MKKMTEAGLCCAAVLALMSFAHAAPRGPLPGYLEWAANVCVAKVKSVDAVKVTFEVTEVLRGKPPAVLTLTPAPGFDFKPGTEWLLMSCDPGGADGKDSVGWLMDGYCNWLPWQIEREGVIAFVQDIKWGVAGSEQQDKGPEGTPGWTLEHVKKLVEAHPYKGKEK